jgi:hypothetical protein
MDPKLSLSGTLCNKQYVLGIECLYMQQDCSKLISFLVFFFIDLALTNETSVETAIRKKALATPGFPFREVVNEFMIDRDRVPGIPMTLKRPKLFHLMVLYQVCFVDT